MNLQKGIILGIIILMLLSATILIGNGGKSLRSTKSQSKFSELIEDGNLKKLTLIIYYMNPFILTRAPLSADNLIKSSDNDSDTHKIVINGDRLEEHIDLLIQLNNAALIPVEQKSYLNTRLCYVFETDRDDRIFEVAMGGVKVDDEDEYAGGCLYVNGLAVEENDIFYDVLIPFLTEDAVKDLEIYFNKENQDEEAESNE